MDELDSLATKVGLALKAHGLMLTTAESCTGGLVSATVTEISGSSAWFDRSFITYSNYAKIEMLGVLPETLEKFGAVSEETAREMAQGALKHSRADIAISITGIAGPDGGTQAKPVGTVCFAWVGKNIPLTSTTKKLSGDRHEVRNQSTATALGELLNVLSSLT